ncbi:NACHT domain-containing protein [Sphaerisporangium aureirubrum]|uniref:NACHT domain-containing protein n=1 Tax=Sphaerisporangium aureirubrum TaxID=1544736 RepID=A0ABW1NBQ6_9ACTN
MVNEDDAQGELAAAVITAVFKVLLPDVATRVEGLAEVARIIRGRRGSRREENYLHRRLLDAADVLAGKLSEAEGALFSRGVEAGEKEAAIAGVMGALQEVRLSKAEVVGSGLSEGVLVGRVEGVAARLWREAGVSEAGVSYGRLYLLESCRSVVQLVRDLPEFRDELLEHNAQISRRVLELLERSLDTLALPRHRAGTEDEHERFEDDYLHDVVSTYKDCELFGLNVPRELRQQPVDIAYITLTTSGTTAPVGPLGREIPESAQVAWQGPFTARVDAALARVCPPGAGARILLTGTAGSGKTTAMQWLAIMCARRRLPPVLRRWNGRVPFVVQLRNVFRGPATVDPVEEDLIAAAKYRIRSMPGDWISRRLESGRALILLDGFDELSALHRRDAEIWIRKLMDASPRSDIIVTSRLEGVDRQRFVRDGFTHLQLQPMDHADIRRCVDAWFVALLKNTDPALHADYVDSKRRLLTDLERRAALRELAETPLLCAMLCAFYAYKLSASGPQSRSELYKGVVGTLVHARDMERKALLGDMTQKEKLSLLQSVARHMTDRSAVVIGISPADAVKPPAATRTGAGARGRSSAGEDVAAELSAVEVVEVALRDARHINLTAREALDQLLARSVVFRQVSRSEADFAHRSFQEYLAAEDYVITESFQELTRHIGSPQWHRVISFAAGSLSKPAADRLLQAMIRWIDTAADPRPLILLLAECVNAAVRVAPEVVAEVTLRLARILPPRTFTEAEAVAHGGEGLLYALDQYADRDPLTVAACVRTAALIGGMKALDVISAYSRVPHAAEVAQEIVEDWRYFDAEDYVDRVLTHMDLSRQVVRVSSPQAFLAAGRLTRLTRVRLEAVERLPDLHHWRRLDGLHELHAGSCPGLHTLHGVEALTGLRRLNLSGNPQLTDLTPLAGLPWLRELYLAGNLSLTSGAALGNLAELRVLRLDGCRKLTAAPEIAGLERLQTLTLLRCGIDHLDFTGTLTDLRMLRASELKHLRDLHPLSGAKRLRVLELTDCSALTTGEGIEGLTALEELDLSGSGLGDLDFAESLTGLRVLRLSRCRYLRDVSALTLLPGLEVVRLPPQIPFTEVERLQDECPDLAIEHEPPQFVGEAGA